MTYLSPSGGRERAAALDDGDVLGLPGDDRLTDLLEAGLGVLAAAHERAVAAPIEIIVEPEARMCSPVVPTALVPVRAGDDLWEVHPELVVGVDDAVVPTASAARAGVAALNSSDGSVLAYTPACLWLDTDGWPAQLSLGPVLVTADELGTGPLRVSAEMEERELGRGLVDPADAWLTAGPGRIRALLPVATPPLAANDELFVDADTLGTFEVRVGSQV
ncbi:hypothetical protein HNR10_001274 [Nocardiopsis aegyptia]|uniref:2-keto-4-pentenoate hydratase n=1 Tax=Nocardiopsis aegyptia TaxID=220378 RepID=A0A7Z0J8R7_9ACTN|nr:hypothetical protein [Nocardiopsis aegyptia]